MALRLVKPIGDLKTPPSGCKCGSLEFSRIGHGWACQKCFTYVSVDFGKYLVIPDGSPKFERFQKE